LPEVLESLVTALLYLPLSMASRPRVSSKLLAPLALGKVELGVFHVAVAQGEQAHVGVELGCVGIAGESWRRVACALSVFAARLEGEGGGGLFLKRKSLGRRWRRWL
jgi:hypothetical protein